MDLFFLKEVFLVLIIALASLSVHEWAHAFVADKMGDWLPRSEGRVTLNPVVHIDFVGSILVPLFMVITNSPFNVLGWGKPVMTDPKNYKYPVFGDIIVSLAGPVANLGLALFLSVLGGITSKTVGDTFNGLYQMAITVNVGFAVFNLIPLPPLDGACIIKHLFGIPESVFSTLSRWGGLLIILLINIQEVVVFLSYFISLISSKIIRIGF